MADPYCTEEARQVLGVLMQPGRQLEDRTVELWIANNGAAEQLDPPPENAA